MDAEREECRHPIRGWSNFIEMSVQSIDNVVSNIVQLMPMHKVALTFHCPNDVTGVSVKLVRDTIPCCLICIGFEKIF